MTRRILHALCLMVGLMAALAAAPALAGGWAVVTLDSLPADVRAGTTYTLGFMVRQHGVTPINIGIDGQPLHPVLTAHNTASGASFEETALQQGETGHFAVNVAFPAAGTWEWEITPAPFAGTRLEPLTVLPAAVAQPQPAPQPVLLIAGLVLLLCAGVLLLARRGTRMPQARQRGEGV